MSLPNEFYVLFKDIWPIIFIFMVVVSTVRISYLIEKHEKFIFYKEFFSLVFVIYVLLLFELVTNTDVQGVSNNFIPFKEILRYKIGSKYFIWNVVGNIIMFVPFGLGISQYLNSKTVTKPAIITLITSTTIETVQMFIGRSFDIDDIILNFAGGILGYLLYKLLTLIKDHLPECLRNDVIYNILTLILIGVACFYSANIGGLITK